MLTFHKQQRSLKRDKPFLGKRTKQDTSICKGGSEISAATDQVGKICLDLNSGHLEMEGLDTFVNRNEGPEMGKLYPQMDLSDQRPLE